MKLRVLGSSSSGNCYLLEATGETLIIEAGIHIAEIKRALAFNFRDVVGCLVSHRHGDHSSSVSALQKYGVNVFTHEDVINSSRTTLKAFCTKISSGVWRQVGSFKVYPIRLTHADSDGSDCPCYGFIIKHREMGNLLFATDTVMIPTKVKGLNHILVEANYCDTILQENIDNHVVTRGERGRLERSHMELETTKRFLQANDLSQVNEIVLLHLSSRNADPALFRNTIAEATGKPVYIAATGLELELSPIPY